MRRRAFTLLMSLASLLAGLLPVGAAFYFSWQYTLNAEIRHLDELSALALARAERVLDVAAAELPALELISSQPCGPEHMQLMRDTAFRAPYVREIAYVRDGDILCSSAGEGLGSAQLPAPDWQDGTRRVWWHLPMGDVTQGSSVGMGQGSHVALIHTDHFLTGRAGDTRLLLLSSIDRSPVAATDEPLLPVMRDVAGSGREHVEGDRLYAVAPSTCYPLLAVGARPRSLLLSAWTGPLMLAMLLGLTVSALLMLAMQRFIDQYLSPANALRTAVRRGDLRVAYHPQIRLSDGRCVGAELLVRWPTQHEPVLSTDDLVRLAEHSGFEHEITARVLAIAMEDIGDLLAGRPDLSVSLNVASHDLVNGSLRGLLARELDARHIARCQIELELTERSLIEAGSAGGILTELRELGHRVLLDDFGTGYSSLSYLQHLPVDALKIDRVFVGTIGVDSPHSPLLPHIIEIARSRRLHMVAEGVETPQQADYLRHHGVEFAQGYLYARPLDAREFRLFLADMSATDTE